MAMTDWGRGKFTVGWEYSQLKDNDGHSGLQWNVRRVDINTQIDHSANT
jgi:hypothetical protein